MTTVSQENLPLIETQSPTDEAAVAAIVRAAGETHTPIYPIGGGTRRITACSLRGRASAWK